jgi:hypothetical protein
MKLARRHGFDGPGFMVPNTIFAAAVKRGSDRRRGRQRISPGAVSACLPNRAGGDVIERERGVRPTSPSYLSSANSTGSRSFSSLAEGARSDPWPEHFVLR